MDDPSDEVPHEEPANLRFLRRLVTVLTATMILGMLTVVTLLVLRFNQSAPSGPTLPNEITLPAGVSARAITFAGDWYAVVTDTDDILIFGRDGSLRQRIEVTQAE